MTIAVDLGRKATKQTNKILREHVFCLRASHLNKRSINISTICGLPLMSASIITLMWVLCVLMLYIPLNTFHVGTFSDHTGLDQYLAEDILLKEKQCHR